MAGRVAKMVAHLSTSSTITSSGKVCLVVGAGAGIGVNVAKRFAREGLVACLCRRSDEDGLDRAVAAIKAAGGQAVGYLLDASKSGAIEDLVTTIEADVGPIDVAVYNLGAQIGHVPLEKTSLRRFELCWQLGCNGLFRLAKSLVPLMAERGSGALLVTSATSAVRGNAGQHAHTAAMGGRRMLCQSLNREFAPRGVHVAHIIVDGAVDAPDTIGRMLGADGFANLKEFKGKDGILAPEALANTYYHIATQHPSAWTFEIDVRPFNEVPWFNS